MSEELQALRSIGAQKIHEQTHIARHHAQALLHESFDDMTKVQFLGFISILQREYSVDLSELKLKGEEFYGAKTSSHEQSTKVFVTPKKKKSYTGIYIVLVVLIAIVFIVGSFLTTQTKTKSDPIDNSAIENAKENIQISESNITLIEDENITKEIVIPEVEKAFKIISKRRLWIGYMDLKTYKKNQKTFSGEMSLDPQKDWLLTLGHGHVDIEIDGEVTNFKDRRNIRFLYKDSNLSKITFEEFKKLNRGKKW